MPDLTGRPIDEPKTPGAHRVWELISIFGQAQGAWNGLAETAALGHAAAWKKQNDVLDKIKNDIEEDKERTALLLSVLTAGVAGGLVGGVASGALKDMNGVSDFVKDFATNTASGAASQLGGSLVSFFQSNGGSPFKSPGLDPTSYFLNMAANISLFFMSLQESIRPIVNDIESGKRGQQEGEVWYQIYKCIQGVGAFPSVANIQRHDFEKEASLLLWIAWGSERDFPYWDRAWSEAQRPPRISLQGDGARFGYLNDIARWDPVRAEISKAEPHLASLLLRKAYDGVRVDLRLLKGLGLFSSIASARALSNALVAPDTPLTSATAKKILSGMKGIPSIN